MLRWDHRLRLFRQICRERVGTMVDPEVSPPRHIHFQGTSTSFRSKQYVIIWRVLSTSPANTYHIGVDGRAEILVFRALFKKNLNASKPSEHPPQVEECLKMLGCGSFVRGRKRKKGLTQDPCYINEEITRGDYMMSERRTGEARRSLPIHQHKLPSIPIIYIPNPFYQMTVQHRGPSPASKT